MSAEDTEVIDSTLQFKLGQLFTKTSVSTSAPGTIGTTPIPLAQSTTVARPPTPSYNPSTITKTISPTTNTFARFTFTTPPPAFQPRREHTTTLDLETAKGALSEFTKLIPNGQWARSCDQSSALLSLTELTNSLQAFGSRGYALSIENCPLACTVCHQCKTVSTNHTWLYLIQVENTRTNGLDRVLACKICRRPVAHLAHFISKPYLVTPTNFPSFPRNNLFMGEGVLQEPLWSTHT